MDVGRRAKQFAPFAALRGLDETIRQQEIIYEPKRDLSEEKKNELDMKLKDPGIWNEDTGDFIFKSSGRIHPLVSTIHYPEP